MFTRLWVLLAGVLLAPVVSATNLTATSELFMGGRTFEAHHPPGYRVEFLNLELILPRILFFHGERLFIGSRSGNIYRLDPPYTETHSIAKLPDYPRTRQLDRNQCYQEGSAQRPHRPER